MAAVSLPAHFDGKHILLDAPYTLEPDTKLLVTVLPPEDAETEDWRRLFAHSLNEAYSETEEEYPLDSIREANPDYEGR